MSAPPPPLSPLSLASPPRRLPIALTLRVVLGGVLSQMGWIILLFSVVFVWAFDPGPALVSAARFASDLGTADGTVSGWGETSLTINDRRVYETRYAYAVDGRPLVGSSYRTGSHLEPGERVSVEYLLSDPAVSRIAGMRPTAAGAGIAFVLVFPLVGLGLVVAGMRKGIRARRLMSTGRLALGALKAKEPTSTVVNNKTVYRMTFEFQVPGGGTYEVVGRTHRPSQLEDEAAERLVYDPRDPRDAALLDELPCRPGIDGRGNFVVEHPLQRALVVLNLLAPVLAVASYSMYLATR